MAIDHAARARALVGTRFRPQGRTAEGVDCVGLLLATYGIAADAVRRDYRLRGNEREQIVATMHRFFRRVAARDVRAGDAMLFEVGSDRFHLAVKTHAGIVHADAGVGRVVERAGTTPWPLIGAYRPKIRKS